jgi:hypothetical protein
MQGLQIVLVLVVGIVIDFLYDSAAPRASFDLRSTRPIRLAFVSWQ